MTATKQSLTFFGLGNMGAAIVQSLTKAGFDVTAWNRTADRPLVKATVASGAIFEPDVAVAISKNDILATALLDYESIRSALSDIPFEALSGKTFINIASGTPREAAEMQHWMRGHGVSRYVEAAIMATPPLVGGSNSFLVVSGEDAQAFEEVAAVLKPAGKCVYMGTDIDAAARYDFAALAAMYGMLGGGYLAMALLNKGGKNTKLAPTVAGSIVPFLSAVVPLLGGEAASWDAGNFDDHGGAPIGMQLHGVKKLVQSAKEDGIDAGALEHLMGVFERVVRDRGGEGGTSVVPSYLMGP